MERIVVNVMFVEGSTQFVLREDTNEYSSLASLNGKVIHNIDTNVENYVHVEVKDIICPTCKGVGEDWSGDTFRYCRGCGGAGEREGSIVTLMDAGYITDNEWEAECEKLYWKEHEDCR